MDPIVSNYVATGGVSGAVVCVFYFAYKCLYKKKIHSECCGNTMDIKSENSPSVETKKETLDV
jgi:hypothetical protein